MKDAGTIQTPLDLTVRFVGGPPIDEIVYWIRSCAERQHVAGALTVAIETKTKAHSRVYEVRLERPDRILVKERDANLMHAIRNAFGRLPSTPERFMVPAAERRTRAAR